MIGKIRHWTSRRAMIQSLCGGLGTVGLSGLFGERSPRRRARPLHRNANARESQARDLLFMAGGPSHVDMFDPKPLLVEISGRAAEFRRLADRAADRRVVAVAVSVSEIRGVRNRGQRTVAEAGRVDRRNVRDPLDVHVQSHPHAGARPVSHPAASLATRPSTGAWLSYGLGTENENLPAFVVLTPVGQAAKGRCRVPDSCPPSIRASASATRKSSRRR